MFCLDIHEFIIVTTWTWIVKIQKNFWLMNFNLASSEACDISCDKKSEKFRPKHQIRIKIQIKYYMSSH